MAPWQKWTAWRLLDGNGWSNGSSTAKAIDDTTAPRRRGTAQARQRWAESTTVMGGDGRRNGRIDGDGQCGATAMDGTTADGKGRHDGGLMTMDDEERYKRHGDVDTAGGGSNKGQHTLNYEM
jgi:hypothetical protein